MKILFLLIVSFGFIGWSFGVMAAAPINSVIRIIDGDTVEIMGEGKKPYTARLSGIDAPEIGQPFGKKSKKLLSKLIYKKIVRVVVQNKPDIHGRIIARLYVGILFVVRI